MKLKITLMILFAGLLLACEKNEETPKENGKTTINGEAFVPTESSITVLGKQLTIFFSDGVNEVNIITNETIEGTYNVVAEQLKSSSLKVNIEYTDGTKTYKGISGTLVLQKNENTFSGSYEATMQSVTDNSEIEISGGSFSDIEGLVEELLISTETEINDTLISCYSQLTDFIQLEFLFDAVYSNQITVPSSSWNDIHSHSQNTSNEQIIKLWNDAWDIIFKANLIVLSATENISDELVKNQIIAQAKTIRAHVNFQLVKWFGEIPIIEDLNHTLPQRSSVEEVLQLIISDSQEAEGYLPETWSSPNENRINRIFVQSLISKAFMYAKNYNEVYNINQQIINSGVYNLSVTTDNFQEDNVEFYWGFAKGNYYEFNSVFNKGGYIPVSRFTETILSYAEAALMLGNTMEALNNINRLKTRRGEMEITNIDMDMIFQQYKVELNLEGETFCAMKRFDKALDELQIDDFKLLLPIPQEVINSNPNVTQNPGY